MENQIIENKTAWGNSDFSDLNCWQKARELRIEISHIVKTFPVTEKYRLTDQLIRASRSVADCIAEGYGRYHYKDSIRFCYMSRGSLFEVKNHLLTALDENYISTSIYNKIDLLRTETTRLLNGYIRFLQTKSQKVV